MSLSGVRVSGEAASLAGHLKLANLCWIYDSNRVTIEGHTELAFSEDVASRFLTYGWNVTRVGDANDLERCRPVAAAGYSPAAPGPPEETRPVPAVKSRSAHV